MQVHIVTYVDESLLITDNIKEKDLHRASRHEIFEVEECPLELQVWFDDFLEEIHIEEKDAFDVLDHGFLVEYHPHRVKVRAKDVNVKWFALLTPEREETCVPNLFIIQVKKISS